MNAKNKNKNLHSITIYAGTNLRVLLLLTHLVPTSPPPAVFTEKHTEAQGGRITWLRITQLVSGQKSPRPSSSRAHSLNHHATYWMAMWLYKQMAPTCLISHFSGSEMRVRRLRSSESSSTSGALTRERWVGLSGFLIEVSSLVSPTRFRRRFGFRSSPVSWSTS